MAAKKKVKINRASPLVVSPLIDGLGHLFWDVPVWPEFVPQTTDRFITVDSEYVGKLDLVAFDEYGDVDYWWVIALVNDVLEIPSDIYLGRKLRIPSKGYVDGILARTKV